MTGLVGKTLGKITFICEEQVPEDFPRRRKYGSIWYKIQCECGNEKLVPKAGSAGMRSCGCSQYDHMKTTANETIKHFPNRTVVGKVRDINKVYKDL